MPDESKEYRRLEKVAAEMARLLRQNWLLHMLSQDARTWVQDLVNTEIKKRREAYEASRMLQAQESALKKLSPLEKASLGLADVPVPAPADSNSRKTHA